MNKASLVPISETHSHFLSYNTFHRDVHHSLHKLFLLALQVHQVGGITVF